MARWDPFTIEQAKEKYYQWSEAAQAVATSQSYTIDGRTLTRANLDEIRKMMAYWKAEVERMLDGKQSLNRVLRVVPRDL